ncbi:MAG: formyltetrahydrofolate deformylase [Planctomycetaceae bacterium]|nr:formyltetrahydrofolate deformylase [Planctomycetaceae bacterium]MBN8602879.1 formyltetrahydrofolate deformylase [Planctomycetota bacterium]
MEITITAIGPDNVGLADPIIHSVTTLGANIAEIQMYDHDEAAIFAMLCRIHVDDAKWPVIDRNMKEIADRTGLSIRVWSPSLRAAKPRLAICTTFLDHVPKAVLQAIETGQLKAEAAVIIGNRRKCEPLAERYGVPFEFIGNPDGSANDERMVELLDQYQVDYVLLARYMRIVPPDLCWKYAGGRIINLHHGLLPGFKGLRPYHDAYQVRMLTFGATCHFIVPELDAGNQIIYQSTFTVSPGSKLEDIIRRGQEQNEPHCMVEGVRRVLDREVQLHFHRVIARKP